MKRIASAIALCLLIVSCTPEGDTYTLEILPVAKVETETAFAKDSVTEISVKYLRPSNCHFYEDFYFFCYFFYFIGRRFLCNFEKVPQKITQSNF